MEALLKKLHIHLVEYLEAANNQEDSSICNGWSCAVLKEELLCCCERARLAIKDFTNQPRFALKFDVIFDALRDLLWSFDQNYRLAFKNTGFRFALDTLLDLQRSLLSDPPGLVLVARLNSKLLGVMSNHLSPGFLRKTLFELTWILLPLRRLKELHQREAHTVFQRDILGSSSYSVRRPGLPPGLNLDDLGAINYIKELGQGAQGSVYEALWREEDPIAVKEVLLTTRSEALDSVSFAPQGISGGNLDQELEVLKSLSHPNVIELKGYTRTVHAGKYGLVMELMERSLADVIQEEAERRLEGQQGRLSKLASIDTLLQVARGMHFLHAKGILHRDLKPGNVLVKQLDCFSANTRPQLGYMVAKLADFGLSKWDLTEDAGAAGWHTYKQGTSFYMAPELRVRSSDGAKELPPELRTKCADDAKELARYARSADVFSFGTTCFNVLTLELIPCTREGNPLTIREFYKRVEKADLGELLEKCETSEVASLVGECWRHDPSRRPTFWEICQILEEEKRGMVLAISQKEYSCSLPLIKEEKRSYTSSKEEAEALLKCLNDRTPAPNIFPVSSGSDLPWWMILDDVVGQMKLMARAQELMARVQELMARVQEQIDQIVVGQ